MATQRSTRRKKKPTAKAVASKKHKHRVAGTKAKKAAVLGGLLDAIGGTKTAKKKKKDKPIIRMDEHAAELLELQQTKTKHKALGSRIKALESMLADDAEDLRKDYCIDNRNYFGSVTLQAIETDDDGNIVVDAGEVNYGVKRQHIKFDPRAVSADDDVIEEVGEGATVRDEAILAISNALDCDWDTAEAEYESRIETKTVISLSDGALDDPDVVAILQEHLAEWLESETRATPSEGFSEQACYDAESITIMDALNGVGLCKRYKATFKASGAPKQNMKPAKRK